MTEKDALVYVEDGDNLHIAWEYDEDLVVVFERVPNNYPSTHLGTWNSLEEYYEAISDVDWIINSIDVKELQEYIEKEVFN